MSLRWKLLFAFGATTLVAVAVVALVATRLVRNSYVNADRQRIEQVLAQAQSAIQRRGEQAARRVAAATEDEAVTRIAISLNQPRTSSAGADTTAPAAPTPGSFLADAATIARARELDLLEVVADDATVLSSAQWEARAGYPDADAAALASRQESFIRLEDLPSGPTLAVEAAREVNYGARKLYLVGGYRLDESFVAELNQPGIEHAVLFRAAGPGQLAPLSSTHSPDVDAELGKVAARAALTGAGYRAEEGSGALALSTVAGTPLRDVAGRPLGVFVVTVSGAERARVIRSLYWAALVAGALGLLASLLLSVALAQRITAPVSDLVAASQQLAAGNLEHRIQPRGDDEIARLSESFNRMAASLKEHRERLVQSERVAAWRELARRLAHELKNPLFPLQLSIENLRRARQVDPAHFDEAFEEATSTLLAELDELKRIVAQFSDFAKMPQPQREPTELKALLERAAHLYEARISQQKITLDVSAEGGTLVAMVDPHLLGNAIGNLVLNALDAMPGGGRLSLRAGSENGRAVIEVRDSGQGLTEEEQRRLFTPYYTTKKHGTGLGLAIVQSVVADHGGRISVDSAPDRGTRFRIELPLQ